MHQLPHRGSAVPAPDHKDHTLKYYAIADLHGRFDLLLKAVDQIYQHAGSPDYKIITLGDYIDRGPQSKDVIEYLRQQKDFICLQGNHEAMAVECITHALDTEWWIGNGGDTTLRSYGWGGAPYPRLAYDSVPLLHLQWMRDLPLYYETEKQMFVHAGMPQWGMNVPPSSSTKGERLKQQMQWMLYSKTDVGGWKGKHVVHGHHQFADGPHVWLDKRGGRTDLDTFAWYTNRLVVGVFDDTQLEAVDFIEVTVG